MSAEVVEHFPRSLRYINGMQCSGFAKKSAAIATWRSCATSGSPSLDKVYGGCANRSTMWSTSAVDDCYACFRLNNLASALPKRPPID